MAKQLSCFLLLCITVLLEQSSSYEWEAPPIIKRVRPYPNSGILYASIGGKSNNIRHLAPQNPWSRNHWSSDPGVAFRSAAIPPTFITGAQVHDARAFFGGRLSIKPKRWAKSVMYQPKESYTSSTNRENSERGTEDTRGEPTHDQSVAAIREEVNLGYPEPFYQESNQRSDESINNPFSGTHDDQCRTARQHELENRIRQEYLSGPQIPREYYPKETDSYKVVMEKEYREPTRIVRRSPSPWPRRDTDRMGPPRHEECMLPLDRGVGPDDLSSWYYDQQERQCRWFGYRGHGGNANRFYSRMACEAYCLQDLEDLCQVVSCPSSGLTCTLVDDPECKQKEERYGRDWRLKCPPDHPVCMSRRGTRIAPNVSTNQIPPECFMPKDSGSCQKKNPSVNFYYDSERNACMTFYYHNCGGNDNRFETKTDCMTHCSP